jgi:protein-S-isoprenylcysteine O-methyltransferase Ste14
LGRAGKIVWEIVLGRIVPVLAFGTTAGLQVLQATQSQVVAGESVEDGLHFARDVALVLLYVLLTVTYATRLPRASGERRVVVVVVTLLVAGSSMLAGLYRIRSRGFALDLASTAMVAAGTAYATVALIHLRRSFSLLPEARELVTTGPYALSRHPMVLGEMVAMVGAVLPAFAYIPEPRSAVVLILVPFLAGQWMRMGWEESVLRAQLPAYTEYATRVPRFGPWPKGT